MTINIASFISNWENSQFSDSFTLPWHITKNAPEILQSIIANLSSEFQIRGDIAIHSSAKVEEGAVLKGPIILSCQSFVASGAYLRGGVFLGPNCIVGPYCELKTTIMFNDSKVAHLSFVGDSIIGNRANIEAGAMIANYRNEMDDKHIKIKFKDNIIDTGIDKFGALVGDDVKIGANAVLAPGSIIEANKRVQRLGIIDQHPTSLTL